MKTFYYLTVKALLSLAFITITNFSFAQVAIKNCANGFHHNLFITNSDSLWVFGQNDDGQLGDGTNSDILTAKSMNMKAIGMAGGYNFSIVIKTDSTLVASGNNSKGELGIGNTTSKNVWTPINTTSGAHFRQVAASADHAAAVTGNGLVYAWGANDKGECGDNSTTQRNSPVLVKKESTGGNLTNIIKVACGSPDNDANTGGHTIALASDGTVWAWGLNDNGQLGDGTGGDRKRAVQVVGIGGSGVLTNVVDIAASGNSSYALLANGKVVSWGSDANGQLGNGFLTSNRQYPNYVKKNLSADITNITQISASSAGLSDDFLSMLSNSGKIYNVGTNNRGQLGLGNVLNQGYAVQNNPSSSRNYKQVVANGHYQIMLSNDTLGNYCETGHMTNGSFGNGSSSNMNITGLSCMSQAFVTLPVTLASFTVKKSQENASVIRWTTATETNNDRFDIEYSTDGKEYDVIGTIKGGGTSYNTLNYQYIHKGASKTKTCYYRLKQIDFNGDFEYHKTIVVTPGSATAGAYSYPNPTKENINVTLTEETNTDYVITVMDQTGRVIASKEGHVYTSPVSEKFELEGLDKGFYFVTIKTSFGTTTEKIVKQ